MSNGPWGNSNQTIFSSGTPHFFTIILEETLQENKLRIPQKFVRKYGETLCSSVFVKLPCGSKWNMKLTKKDNNIWLDKGWPDFAKHYLIKRGTMLIFRYEGNSEFYAIIFDTSTVEIEYPSIPFHFEEVENDSFEISNENESQPHKRMSPNVQVHENSLSTGNLQSPEPKTIGKSAFVAKSDRDKSTTRRQEIDQNINLSGGAIHDEIGEPSSVDYFPSKQASGSTMSVPWKTSQGRLANIKKARILELVPFESEKPFFKVLMQPTYVGRRWDHLRVPLDFAMRYLKKECDAILSVPNGRSWFAELKMTPPKVKGCWTRLHKGWPEFAKDNKLEVGDVCIFKLVDETKISFEVSIVRFAEYECNSATTANNPKGPVKVKIEID